MTLTDKSLPTDSWYSGGWALVTRLVERVADWAIDADFKKRIRAAKDADIHAYALLRPFFV